MNDNQIFVCPECGSDQVTSEHHQAFMINTGEHYCHTMKTQDADSPSKCLTCGWEGELRNLLVIDDPKAKKKEAKERAQYEKLKAKFEVNHD